MFQPSEPVTICDQFIEFINIQFEHEISRKAFNVSFYLLIERFGADAI
jgi:hypothetical protein